MGVKPVLLVEGSTDVKVIQHFLRLIKKDAHVLILPLGRIPDGDELDEVARITPDVAVLIDSEREAEGAGLENRRKSFLELCAGRKFRAAALERRAIENYFPDSIVKRVFGNTFRGLTPYERLGDVQPHWSKSQNWKLASAMDFESIRQTDLGAFLEAL